MPEATYCSLDDVRNRLSADGVDLRLDDDPPDEGGDVLDNAASVIEEHCRPRYTTAQLTASRWVKQRATDIAAYLLCERRGNPPPPGVARAFVQYVGDGTRPGRLEKVRTGSLLIPDISLRKTEVPVLSNVRIRLDPFPRTVVERNRSTGQAEGYKRNTDSLEYLPDYSI